MILGWVVSYLLIALLLGMAAMTAERLCRLRGWPGRWPWFAAMVGSVAVPELPGLPAWKPVARVVDQWVNSTSSAALALDAPLINLTFAAFLLALAVLILVTLRTSAARQTWRPVVVQGERCLIAPNAGPSAVGLFRGTIVLPEWALHLKRESLRLILAHEREHLRGGDPRMLLAGLLILVLLPWNLPLWWQWRRLRRAIELDCDARVLQQTGALRPYTELLLAVGGRQMELAGMAGLAARSDLRHRLMAMTAPAPSRRQGGTLVLACNVLVLAGLALMLSGVMCAWCKPLSLVALS